jgi:tetratricopeptide (TPR) repeat protein
VFKLKDEDKAEILSITGYTLRAVGRLEEAIQPLQSGLSEYINQEHWEYAAIDAGNLSELYLTLGEVNKAIELARKSVYFADRSDNVYQKMDKRTLLADTLHQSGKIFESYSMFIEAENIQKEINPDYPLLHSFRGFRFCELLLSQARYKDIQKRAVLALHDWIKLEGRLLDIGLDKLSLGKAYLAEALTSPFIPLQKKKILNNVADYLNQAVAGLREAGNQDDLPRGLFARAFCYRLQNQFPQAWNDLEEAREIAERGEMKLWLVDYHLEASRLLISEFGFRNADHQHVAHTVETFHENTLRDVETFHEMSLQQQQIQMADDHLKQASELVKQTKYHRRDPEVELGYAGLFLAQGDQVKAREHLGKAKVLLDKMGIRCWDFEVQRLEEGIW